MFIGYRIAVWGAPCLFVCFFFNDTATTEIYTLSLHDALPITLSELSYSPARHEKQRIAGLLGAAGCVMMNWGHDTNASVPWGSVKPVWGNPTPDNYGTEMPVLPCIGIARTEGLKLREMAKKGPVRLRFRTKVENGWRPIWITTGEIPT